MTFSEFIQLLFSAIGAGNSTSAFTKSVLDAVVTEAGSEILSGYKEPTFKAYYNGNTEITKLARKINAYIDKTGFEEYLEPFSDDVVLNLCNSFEQYIPDIDAHNAGEKLSELLVSIITAAACTNKKRTLKGAEEHDDIDLDASTALILGNDGVAPDLGAFVDGNILYLNCDGADAQTGVFDKYISKASEHYNNVKTPLSADNPFPFYSVYVCNDLYNRFLPKVYREQTISNATIASLSEISRFIIVSGTGGIGKSMLMKHLFFSSVTDLNESGLLPILLPLRKYDESIQDLTEFIYRIVAEFDRGVPQEDITKLLKGGKCILLLDGLDEVVSSVRSRFETALEAMIKQYPENTYILSSRPTSTFLSFPRFTVLNMRPFDKEKALEMIDKLPYHDAEAKAKFRGDLDKNLFKSHQQFASNPLLLTIMLMTYTTNGNIPQKRHVFYSQAYDVMARKHDSSEGSYVRPMHTGLEPEDFAKYYAEFCARTYKDEVYEFTEQSFISYMDKVLAANGLKNGKKGMKLFVMRYIPKLCYPLNEAYQRILRRA